MPWGAVAGAVVGGVVNSALSPKQGGGGSNGAYAPGHLGGADDTWWNATQNQYDLAQAGQNAGVPGYNASFDRSNGLNWDPYLQRADQAGQAYGQTGDAAMGQVGQYGQMATGSQQQQQQMYGAAGQVMQTAMDPQHALYDRTAQQLQDQVRAGQAARGLGNSAAGAGEEDQAMSNFNIDWQNNQLGRQATGIGAANTAVGAGVNAGRMAGADMSAGLGAGAAGAGYYAQAGQVPMGAQQQWAAYPGQTAAQLESGYANVQQGYGVASQGAIPYMNAGNGALATQWQNQYQTNRDAAAGMGQIGSAVGTGVQNYGQQQGWWGGGASGPQQSWDPTQYSTPGGGDTYYGSGQNWGV